MSPSVFNPWKKNIEANTKAMRQQKKNANSLSHRVSSSMFEIFVISIHWWWRKKFCLWLATHAESTRQHKARTFFTAFISLSSWRNGSYSFADIKASKMDQIKVWTLQKRFWAEVNRIRTFENRKSMICSLETDPSVISNERKICPANSSVFTFLHKKHLHTWAIITLCLNFF